MINLRKTTETNFEEHRLSKKGEGVYQYERLPISLDASTENLLDDFYGYLGTLKNLDQLDKRLLKDYRVPSLMPETTIDEYKEQVFNRLQDVKKKNQESKDYFEAREKQAQMVRIQETSDNFLDNQNEMAKPFHRIWEGNCHRCGKNLRLICYMDAPDSHQKALGLKIYGVVADDSDSGIHFCNGCEYDRENQRVKERRAFDKVLLKPFLEALSSRKGAFQFSYKEYCDEYLLDKTHYPKVETLCRWISKDLNKDILFKVDKETEDIITLLVQ